eukprot:4980867-Alexandrium_andersonii.AAC.1
MHSKNVATWPLACSSLICLRMSTLCPAGICRASRTRRRIPNTWFELHVGGPADRSADAAVFPNNTL